MRTATSKQMSHQGFWVFSQLTWQQEKEGTCGQQEAEGGSHHLSQAESRVRGSGAPPSRQQEKVRGGRERRQLQGEGEEGRGAGGGGGETSGNKRCDCSRISIKFQNNHFDLDFFVFPLFK